jgi:hypothetical protein
MFVETPFANEPGQEIVKQPRGENQGVSRPAYRSDGV